MVFHFNNLISYFNLGLIFHKFVVYNIEIE
jgi:hypothetical protein